MRTRQVSSIARALRAVLGTRGVYTDYVQQVIASGGCVGGGERTEAKQKRRRRVAARSEQR